jgi:hypothetical protein
MRPSSLPEDVRRGVAEISSDGAEPATDPALLPRGLLPDPPHNAEQLNRTLIQAQSQGAAGWRQNLAFTPQCPHERESGQVQPSQGLPLRPQFTDTQ